MKKNEQKKKESVLEDAKLRTKYEFSLKDREKFAESSLINAKESLAHRLKEYEGKSIFEEEEKELQNFKRQLESTEILYYRLKEKFRHDSIKKRKNVELDFSIYAQAIGNLANRLFENNILLSNALDEESQKGASKMFTKLKTKEVENQISIVEIEKRFKKLLKE